MSRDGFYERPNEIHVDRERRVLSYKGARSRPVSGVPFHTPPWSLMQDRLPLELEMIPEPRNPWDVSAVALDFEGQRIGYLPAELAPAWQPYVTAMRNEGAAIFLPAAIRHCDRVDVRVPGRRILAQLAESAGLGLIDTRPRMTRVYYLK